MPSSSSSSASALPSARALVTAASAGILARAPVLSSLRIDPEAMELAARRGGIRVVRFLKLLVQALVAGYVAHRVGRLLYRYFLMPVHRVVSENHSAVFRALFVRQLARQCGMAGSLPAVMVFWLSFDVVDSDSDGDGDRR